MSNDYGYPTNITNATALGADNFKKFFGVDQTQVAGALAAIGAGVVSGLQVTTSGGITLSVGSGRAIVQRTTGNTGYIALETVGGDIDLPDDTVTDDVWYVFAAAELAVSSGDADSRFDGHAVFVVQAGDTLDGAALLAQVTVTDSGLVLVDRRALLGSSSLLDDIYDNGRIVGSDFTDGAPVAGTGLVIELPANGKWLIQNQRLLLAGDVEIADAPASGTSYGFLSLDADTGEPTVLADDWYSSFPTGDTLSALRAAGKPCLGKVTTDTDSVTALDTTAATGHADLIYTQAGLLTLIDGAGGEGGTAYWGALSKSSGDPQTIEQAYTSAINAAKAELQAAISAGGARPQTTSLDQMMHDIALLIDATVAQLPAEGERYEAAMVVKTTEGIYGDGTDDHPDHIDTELTIDSETGEITT